jgi:phosphomannomutase/phosphoglucomutase
LGKLFGTNGVRGVANNELTVEMISRLAASAGAFLGKDIALGMDGRTTSPMFKRAAVSGLLSVGCSVYDVGMLPTPALQFYVRRQRLNGGLMVTASHNPPEFNGVKVMACDGVEISREQESEIERTYFKGGPELCPWNRIGRILKEESIEAYKEAVIEHVKSEAVKNARLKVALDPGNGVAALTAPDIARELGCNVFTLNVNVDGRFPSRDSEPRPDNLSDLSSLVESSGADVGVAFDGDGDRSIFVDEKGEVHWGDRSFALVAKEYLREHKGAKVATPVSSSSVIEDIVSEGGGEVVWTMVGSVVVSRRMVDDGIMLGGEENGGIMYGPHLEVRDGSMALALILEIMAKEERPLSELFGELPQYEQMKDRVSCPHELKEGALNALQEKVDTARVETMDGVKLWYDDGSWILIRPSGTEPIFRLYAESKKKERVKEILEKNKALIEALIESLKYP